MDCINIFFYREIKQKKLPYFCGVKGGWFCSTFAWTWEWRTAGSDSLIGFDLGGDRDGLRLVIGLHGEWRRPTRAGHIPRVFLICHRTDLGLHPHHLRLGSLTVKNHNIRMAAQERPNWWWYDSCVTYCPYPRPCRSSVDGALPLSLPSDWSLIPSGTSTKSC